mmetsp:Transcript_30465/g.53552  ORF Transcript_30465/g.53552 Transcript_30465/m.53552 type:complete len:114 (+) Transcript_30465:73-414(+)
MASAAAKAAGAAAASSMAMAAATDHSAYEVDGRMRDLEQQEKLELREEDLRKEHAAYLEDHPELRQVLNDFMSSVLLHRPDHVFDFAREYFSAFKQGGGAAAEPAAVAVELES